MYVLAAGGAAATGIDAPTRNTVLVTIVDRETLISANSTRQLTQKIAVVVGPALGGLLLSSFSMADVFWIEAASFVTAVFTVLGIAPPPAADVTSRPGMCSIAEAFAFLPHAV